MLPAFEGVSDVEPTGDWLARVTLDRIDERFGLCLGMARLFLQGTTTGLYAGGRSSFALLFDMNDLFEKFVARTLRRQLRGSGLELSIQDVRFHLVRDPQTEQRLFRLRPDIVVRHREAVYCVVDTKWKRLSPEERKLGIAQGDLYQVLAYAEGYASSAVLLLYPWDPTGGADSRSALLPRRWRCCSDGRGGNWPSGWAASLPPAGSERSRASTAATRSGWRLLRAAICRLLQRAGTVARLLAG